jgi:hypothetical protein
MPAAMLQLHLSLSQSEGGSLTQSACQLGSLVGVKKICGQRIANPSRLEYDHGEVAMRAGWPISDISDEWLRALMVLVECGKREESIWAIRALGETGQPEALRFLTRCYTPHSSLRSDSTPPPFDAWGEDCEYTRVAYPLAPPQLRLEYHLPLLSPEAAHARGLYLRNSEPKHRFIADAIKRLEESNSSIDDGDMDAWRSEAAEADRTLYEISIRPSSPLTLKLEKVLFSSVWIGVLCSLVFVVFRIAPWSQSNWVQSIFDALMAAVLGAISVGVALGALAYYILKWLDFFAELIQARRQRLRTLAEVSSARSAISRLAQERQLEPMAVAKGRLWFTQQGKLQPLLNEVNG